MLLCIVRLLTHTAQIWSGA